MKKDVRLTVRITPGAKEDLVAEKGGLVLIRTRARPVRGEANRAVTALLAQYFGVPTVNVRIVSGHTSRTKTIEIYGR